MQTPPLFELLGWSALPKLYPEILRSLLSEELLLSEGTFMFKVSCI